MRTDTGTYVTLKSKSSIHKEQKKPVTSILNPLHPKYCLSMWNEYRMSNSLYFCPLYYIFVVHVFCTCSASQSRIYAISNVPLATHGCGNNINTTLEWPQIFPLHLCLWWECLKCGLVMSHILKLWRQNVWLLGSLWVLGEPGLMNTKLGRAT